MRSRILFGMLMLALAWMAFSPQAPVIAQVGAGDVVKLGVITYHFDGTVWSDIDGYMPLLGMDLKEFPGVPLEYGAVVLPTFVARSSNQPHSGGGTIGNYAMENKVELVLKEADTAAAQVAAIEAMIAEDVHGIFITPVADVEPIRKALCAALDKGIVVTLGYRNIPSIVSRYYGRVGFVGVEPYAVGTVWGQLANPEYQTRYEKGRGKPVGAFVVGSDFNDSLQADILEGFSTRALENFLGSHVTTADQAYAFTKGLIAEHEAAVFAAENAVMVFIVTDPNVAHGVGKAATEAVQAAKDNDRKISIKVGSYSAPPEWREMYANNSINRIAQGDAFQMFLLGLVQLKMGLVYGEPLHNSFLTLRGGVGTGSYVRYPYFEPVWYPGVPETTNSGDMSSGLAFF
jgi:ABC-type sugar transport system substrate-binding protein